MHDEREVRSDDMHEPPRGDEHVDAAIELLRAPGYRANGRPRPGFGGNQRLPYGRLCSASVGAGQAHRLFELPLAQ